MGHNAIVGQSGGPTTVINSSLAGVFSVCKRLGAHTVYGMRHGVQGLLREEIVDLGQTLRTSADVELLQRTPAMLLGSCRYKLPDAAKDPAVYEALFALLKKYDIGYFFYIGGNDSMDTILKLSDYAAATGSDIRFVGVPKTIDNDLCVTDHTPGYGSAAKYIGTTVRELVRDSTIYDLRSVTVVEIMGRNAGWLTAAAALADHDDCEGAAMICLPEVAFDPEAFVAHVDALQRRTPSIVVAVSEGIRVADGRYVAELSDALSVDPFGHKNLTGTARYLCSLLGHHLKTKTRAVELSTLQRCAAHLSSLTDIEEAYRCGGAAAQAAFDGQTGVMIALRRLSDNPYLCVTEPHDIHGIANEEKTVPLSWIDAENYRILPPFLDYALPLIQGEPTQTIVRGMPGHLTL
ncbi:MAG: 6-phosphofructokinase [Clostridiales bacterium]|nr:6-phosphofructokinase [Clostridiales bacterium]